MNYQEACSILGVSENSNEEECKKAFKKGAAKYHPDINKDPNAETKSKELSEAFSFLKKCNFQKNNYFDESFEQSHEDMSDIFDMFFGGHSFRKTINLNNELIRIELSFKESVLGCSKEIKYNRDEPCEKCTKPNFVAQDGYGNINYCPECNPNKESTSNPKIKKKVLQNKKIPIQAGIQNNTHIQISGAGSWIPQVKKYGNLIIKPIIIPDDKMSLIGVNIISNEEVSLLKALEGGELEVETIQGKHKIKLPPGLKNKQEATLKGFGVPGRGNHIITFKVKYPEDTSKLIEFLKNQTKEKQNDISNAMPQ